MSHLKKLKNLTTTNLLDLSVNKQRKIVTTLAVTAAGFVGIAMVPELAMAAQKFDIDAGVKAATSPFIKGIEDHWGKAVLLTGCGGAVIGEGDARQRAVRAGIAAAAAGGVVLALLAMLT